MFLSARDSSVSGFSHRITPELTMSKSIEPDLETEAVDEGTESIEEPMASEKSESSTRGSWFFRHQHHVYGWGSLIIAVTVFFIPNWESWWGKSLDPTVLKTKLDIRVARGEQVHTDLENVVPISLRDEVQATGRFEVPVYCALLWIDQEGKVEIVSSSGTSRVSTLNYPDNRDKWVNIEGDPGTDSIVLIASSKPITQESISFLNSLKSPPRFSSEHAIRITRSETEFLGSGGNSKSPGKTVNKTNDSVVTYADRIRDELRSKIGDFVGVIFPHQ